MRSTIGRGLAIASVAATALAVTAGGAIAGNGHGKAKGHDKVNAAKQCAKERKALGKDAFGQLYGKPAMKNCKADAANGDDGVTVKEKVNAAKACNAEQADPAFATSHDGKTFDEFYGSNKNGQNAFGKCVSAKATAK
jgi:hypothetical protein